MFQNLTDFSFERNAKAVFALFGGMLLGLVVPAYLTTRPIAEPLGPAYAPSGESSPLSSAVLRLKQPAFRRVFVPAALLAVILALLAVFLWQKSPEQIFAKAARSVVVVHALDASGETKSQGSGVVVGKNEVATNCHIIAEAENILVHQAATSAGEETYRMNATLLIGDDERDFCLLHAAELSDPPAASIAAISSTTNLSVGEEVFAIGAPQGLNLSLSRGVISQLRNIHGEQAAPLIQTDAAISPGSSGGGLFNSNGKLVGITAFKWEGENLNFAIPIEWLEELRVKGQAQLAAAEKQAECIIKPGYECVLSLALPAAQDISGTLDRVWVLARIAAVQGKAGDMASARDTLASALIATQSMKDLRRRISAMSRIGWALAEIGDKSSARDTFAAALSLARNLEGTDYRLAITFVVRAQAEAGDTKSAFSTVANLADSGYRALALRATAKELARTKNFDSALTVAASISDSDERALALAFIAEVQALRGDKPSARNTDHSALHAAQSIDDRHMRISALAKVASAQAQAGDVAGAFATARIVKSYPQGGDVLTGQALADIPFAQAEAGDVDGAFATARDIENSSYRAIAIRGIAIAQAKLGNVDDALATAHGIDDSSDFTRAISEIAQALALTGDVDSAFATIRIFDSGSAGRDLDIERINFARDRSLFIMATVWAESMRFQSAMKAASGIEHPDDRARALTAIADHLAMREK